MLSWNARLPKLYWATGLALLTGASLFLIWSLSRVQDTVAWVDHTQEILKDCDVPGQLLQTDTGAGFMDRVHGAVRS